ncbi:uncharacterized protein LOC123318837 isoform X2 [Coccinella septempunctata]|uniref:uncharacterized protein LOC123318837 isoform X2 n=1 Tax=Coccinella septempunctata TaxID=41139 RepID=UPI001D096E3F|nr:uncharacterized protein LOC123318837 isoform X2 [Coccinella septempunctata]
MGESANDSAMKKQTLHTYSVEHKVNIIKWYLRCSGAEEVQKKYKSVYPGEKVPSTSTICTIYHRFQKRGCVINWCMKCCKRREKSVVYACNCEDKKSPASPRDEEEEEEEETDETVEVCQNDVKHLIQEVKKRPALWHMRSPLYYNRELKREGWSEICAIFAYEMLEEQAADLGNSLQKKWKTLRDDFSRNFLQGKEDPVDYAEDLQFLKAAIDSKNPATKLNPNTGLFEEVTSCETPSTESEEKRRDEEEGNRHFLLSLQGNLSTLPRDFNWKCRFELMQVLSIYNELAAVQQKNPVSQTSTHRQEQQQTNQNSQVLCVSIRNPDNTSGTPDPQATTLISVENIDENSNTGRPVETPLGSSLENQHNVHKKRKLEEPSADLDPVVGTWCQLLAHKLQDMSKPTRESLMHKIDNLVYETAVNAIKVEPMEPLVDSSDQGTVVNDPQESHIKLTLDEDSIWTQTIKRECEEIELEEPKLMNLKAEPS